MKEELLQELRKASKYENVMGSLFIFTKSRAEDLLRNKYYNIVSFISNILNMVFYVNKEPTINYTLELLSEYTGSVEMLWDLGAIDQSEAEKYFSFAGDLRAELILYKYE